MKNFLLFLGLLVLAAFGYALYQNAPRVEDIADNTKPITTFEECVEAGNPMLESYPEQCKTSDGKTFTRNIGNVLEKQDLIRIDTPRPGEVIASPLTITGEARGFWFFEASFPVILIDWDGRIIAEHFIMTAEDWMTEEFVSFEGTLNFESPYTEGDPEFMKRGTLILRKDNPSGLPEHDDALEFPIRFAE